MICLRLQMNLIVPVTLFQGAFSFDHFTQPVLNYRSRRVLKSNPVRARSKSLMKLIYIVGASDGREVSVAGGFVIRYASPGLPCEKVEL